MRYAWINQVGPSNVMPFQVCNKLKMLKISIFLASGSRDPDSLRVSSMLECQSGRSEKEYIYHLAF